ncbi:MAG: isochorismate synthase [Chloroflexi bacterium]|nr:isochorismate synthase [Chloroflexota bacterium]
MIGHVAGERAQESSLWDSPIRYVVRPLRAKIPLVKLLQHGAGKPRMFWQNASISTAYAAWGAVKTIQATGPDRFDTVREAAWGLLPQDGDDVAPADTAPRLFGGFAFSPDPNDDPLWAEFDAAHFILPRVMITDANGQLWLTVASSVDGPAEDLAAAADRWVQRIERNDIPDITVADYSHPVSYPLTRDDWVDQVTRGIGLIRDGTLQKIVLSRVADLVSNIALDPVSALVRLERAYPATYRFMFEPAPGHAFLGATPELLLEVIGRILRTAAVAGSVARGATVAEDAVLAAELFTSPKERHEHALVVDALRDLLEPVSDQLSFPEEPQILKLGNIQHLFTPFTGHLADEVDILEVVSRLHPTPALGGYPAEAAIEAIREIELFERGWYASPIGWLDAGGGGMFAVAIRSAVVSNDRARLYAGCGIVEQSDPLREWDETRIKFRPMLDALGARES